MIQFFDSLRGIKVPLQKEPRTSGKSADPVKMYVCGPTVYDLAHLGHGRSAVAFDLVRRFLEFCGYEVIFVFNTTDIEDKMIARAEKESITVPELAARLIPEYKSDYSALAVKSPTHNPCATEFIDQMVELIKTLEKKGHTYVLADGVYFDIKTFPEYGKLSHQKLDELEAGARVEERKDKRNHQDFVLWKFKKEGEPSWPSPWGDGRPGWHIECSAMSKTLLGDSFDIHGGGLDLKFPHHECEIAQSEAASDKPLANIWMHNGYITVNKEKMSKSLGNFFTLREIFEKYNPRVVRFFLLSTHYRSPIEYSTDALDQARATLKTLDEFYLTNREAAVATSTTAPAEPDTALITAFTEKLSNDMDIAGALAEMFEWMNSTSATSASPKEPAKIIATLNRLNEVLQIFPVDFTLTEEQTTLLTERASARAQKDWTKSDELRTELSKLGVEVEDGKSGTVVRPRL
ncbi:MAG: cysteine--tRNA ligase [Candidatus Gracilibacteria bacterium]|jgi:cysteinyl-tRNA synthetase